MTTYYVVSGCYTTVGAAHTREQAVAVAREYLANKPHGADVRVDTASGHTVGRIYRSVRCDTGEPAIFGWGTEDVTP